MKIVFLHKMFYADGVYPKGLLYLEKNKHSSCLEFIHLWLLYTYELTMSLINAENVLQKVMVDWVWCWTGIGQKRLQDTETWNTVPLSVMGVRLEAAKNIPTHQ